jgi:proteic killer suppression protein
MVILSRVIASIADKGTGDIWAGADSKAARQKLPTVLWASAQILLDQLDAATQVGDMKLPPSNRLHKLKGEWKGWWSVSINMQYRIVFQFEAGNAVNVQITDYH